MNKKSEYLTLTFTMIFLNLFFIVAGFVVLVNTDERIRPSTMAAYLCLLATINLLAIIMLYNMNAAVNAFHNRLKIFAANPRLQFEQPSQFKAFYKGCINDTQAGTPERDIMIEKLCDHCTMSQLREAIIEGTRANIYSGPDLVTLHEYYKEHYDPHPASCVPNLNAQKYTTLNAIEALVAGIEEYFLLFGRNSKSTLVMNPVMDQIERHLEKKFSVEEIYDMLTKEIQKNKFLSDATKTDIDTDLKNDLAKRKA